MIKINTLKFLLITFFVTSTYLVYAQNKSFSKSSKEPSWLQKVNTVNKKPKLKDIQDGYYHFLYERQNNLETNEQYFHFIKEINSSAGVQNGSEISVSYDPSYEKVIFHKLIIWRDNKPINQLVVQNFKILQNEKELSRFIYSGLFSAYAILDDIRKGDRIEYAYTIKGSNPVFPKYSNTVYFEGGSQVVNLYYNIIYNPSRNIKTKNFNDVPVVKKSQVNGLNVLEWQNSMTKTFTTNDFEPSEYDPLARTQISEYNDWSEIVNWGIGLHKYNAKNAANLSNKIAELKAKSKGSKLKYFELATRFVQDEIRYMGIEIGEYSHRPNTPENILKQRYGDCKDKSSLLCYLLNANDITSYPVFLNTYLNNATADLLPSPTVFNHETLMVEIDDRTIYIDPTISEQRGPILNSNFPYNAKVLVIKPDTKSLTGVSQLNHGKLKSLVVFKLGDTTSTSTTSLHITSTYTNSYADNFRSDLSIDGADNLEKSYLKYYTNIYPGLTLKEPINISDNEGENIITVTEHYEIKKIWTNDAENNKSLVYFYGDLLNDEVVSLKNFRNAPLSLKFPCTIEQQVKVILPQAWNLEQENLNIDNDNYRYIYSAHTDLDTLKLSYYYQNFAASLAPGDIKQYIKDSKQILKSLSYGIYWNNSGGLNNSINLKLIGIGFITALLAVFGAVYFYTRRTNIIIDKIKNAMKIGGWLILPGIGITISPLTILVTISKLDIYSNSVWQGFLANAHASLLIATIVLTIVLNTILFVYSIFILISFYNRRDLFPKFFIIYLLFRLVITAADTWAGYYIHHILNGELSTSIGYTDVIRDLLAFTIWTLYFLKSERVKNTFVFPFPSSAWKRELMQDLKDNFNSLNITEIQTHETPVKTEVLTTEDERL